MAPVVPKRQGADRRDRRGLRPASGFRPGRRASGRGGELPAATGGRASSRPSTWPPASGCGSSTPSRRATGRASSAAPRPTAWPCTGTSTRSAPTCLNARTQPATAAARRGPAGHRYRERPALLRHRQPVAPMDGTSRPGDNLYNSCRWCCLDVDTGRSAGTTSRCPTTSGATTSASPAVLFDYPTTARWCRRWARRPRSAGTTSTTASPASC